jgi:outer membrane biosynthesis protein TonB
MRLIEAVAASAVLHAGILTMPTGNLSLDAPRQTAVRDEPLHVELRRPPVAASRASESTTKVQVAAEQPVIPPPPPAEVAAQQGIDEPSAGLGIPLPYYYYGPREVSERARPAQDINLEPPGLLGIPGQGRLILLLWISESGGVDRVEIESSQLDGSMEKVIAEQFRRANFSPAHLEGRPVKSRMKIEVVVRPPVSYVVPPPPPRPASAGGS